MSFTSFFEIDDKSHSSIEFEECNSLFQNKLFKDIINKYHSYVKYKDSPTRRIKWIIRDSKSGDPVGAIGISSATLAISARDKFIGWDIKTRIKNLCHVANNSRFCLIPTDDPSKRNRGSQSLKQLRIIGAKRWKEKYGDELVLLETFVLPERDEKYHGFSERRGSVYLSDNWIFVGETSGNHIRKSPLKLWQRENSKRGEMARKNPKECLKLWSQYLGDDNVNGYKITKTEKKMVFLRPLVWNWKKKLLNE